AHGRGRLRRMALARALLSTAATISDDSKIHGGLRTPGVSAAGRYAGTGRGAACGGGGGSLLGRRGGKGQRLACDGRGGAKYADVSDCTWHEIGRASCRERV